MVRSIDSQLPQILDSFLQDKHHICETIFSLGAICNNIWAKHSSVPYLNPLKLPVNLIYSYDLIKFLF